MKKEFLLGFLQEKSFELYSSIKELVELKLNGNEDNIIMVFNKKPKTSLEFSFNNEKIIPEVEILDFQKTVIIAEDKENMVLKTTNPERDYDVNKNEKPKQTNNIEEEDVYRTFSKEQAASLNIKEIPPPSQLKSNNQKEMEKWRNRHGIK